MVGGRVGSTQSEAVAPARRARRRAFAAALVATLAAAGCGNSDIQLLAGPDDVPQSIVLTASAVGETGASLAWTSAGGGSAYRVERNGALVASTSAIEYVERGLAAGQRYCWRVLAYGGVGWQARSNEVCLGTDPGTDTWRVERLAAGRWPAVAIDADGNVHVCFTGALGTGVSWLQAAPGREPELVDVDGQGQCALAVDAAGVVHLAYSSRFGVRHAVRVDRTWRAATVDAEALAGNRRFDGPALVLDASGVPRLAYRRGTTTPAPIAIATRTGVAANGVATGWRFELTGIAGLVGPRSLAVDASGASRLATTDELGQSVVAWRAVSGRWTSEYVQSLAPTRGDGPPIALDARSAPRLAWWRRAAPTTDTTVSLRWAESTASGWVAEEIAASTGLGTRVAIASDAAGTPWVAAVDAAGAVRLFTRAATGWVAESLDGQGGASDALDFAIGRDGQLRVVFDRSVAGEIALGSRTP